MSLAVGRNSKNRIWQQSLDACTEETQNDSYMKFCSRLAISALRYHANFQVDMMCTWDARKL